MTENKRFNDNERHIRRSTDRARAITKAKAKRQKIILSSTAIALVAVIAAGFLVFGAFAPKTKTASAPAASVSAGKDANKAAQNNKQSGSQTATIASQDDGQSSVQTYAQTDSFSEENQDSAQQTQYSDNSSGNSNNSSNSSSAGNESSQEEQSKDKIETVNGERVYIDTKRTAPDGSGTPAHFYANGKTSYGFDWTYDADNNNFAIRCDYNFDEQQYDFQFYGTAPGTSHITVYYNTDDNTQASANLTLTVDDSLNAAIG